MEVSAYVRSRRDLDGFAFAENIKWLQEKGFTNLSYIGRDAWQQRPHGTTISGDAIRKLPLKDLQKLTERYDV